MNIDRALNMIDIQQQLGCAANAGDGLKRVIIAEQGKIGNGIQFIQIRAGDHKEIADHQVRRPGRQQVRQAVKDIKGAFALLRNDGMNLGGKRLKSGICIQFNDSQAGLRFEEWFMLGKPHVNHLAVFPDSPLHVGDYKLLVLDEVVDLPDDVIAVLKPAQHVIQMIKSGTGIRKSIHTIVPARVLLAS